MYSTLKSAYEFRANAVGVVEDGVAEEGERQKGRYETLSRIKIFEKFADGLSGVSEYSHLVVVWHTDRENEVRLKVNPRRNIDMPEVGIFATRFPPRPNHIATSVVELVSISGSYLTVRGLDAWPGSPILDIKPYDYWDIVKNPKVPSWFKLFWQERSSQRHYAKIVPWLGP